MKIEDAIKRYESWAEDDRINILIRNEHRQIVDWLKELKAKRPQGEWIEHHKPFTWMGFTYWTCSECGYGKNNQNWIQSNFCPNCGAKMKGEDDEDS